LINYNINGWRYTLKSIPMGYIYIYIYIVEIKRFCLPLTLFTIDCLCPYNWFYGQRHLSKSYFMFQEETMSFGTTWGWWWQNDDRIKIFG